MYSNIFEVRSNSKEWNLTHKNRQLSRSLEWDSTLKILESIIIDVNNVCIMLRT